MLPALARQVLRLLAAELQAPEQRIAQAEASHHGLAQENTKPAGGSPPFPALARSPPVPSSPP